MFTGLVECKGRVAWTRRVAGAAVIRIAAPFASELTHGESVAVSGVCQTVVRCDAAGFEVDAIAQTIALTTLGDLRSGDDVNLERALKLGDRLGGHMVAGHVDGVARVLEVPRGRDETRLTLELPAGVVRHVVPRGSIALDGVSLTVLEVTGVRVTVALIPETLRATLAGTYRPGAKVNVETDLLAKHREKLLENLGEISGSPDRDRNAGGLTEKRLRELGFTE